MTERDFLAECDRDIEARARRLGDREMLRLFETRRRLYRDAEEIEDGQRPNEPYPSTTEVAFLWWRIDNLEYPSPEGGANAKDGALQPGAID